MRPTPVPVSVPDVDTYTAYGWAGAGACLGVTPSLVLYPSPLDAGAVPVPELELGSGLAPGRLTAWLGGARAVDLMSSGIS